MLETRRCGLINRTTGLGRQQSASRRCGGFVEDGVARVSNAIAWIAHGADNHDVTVRTDTIELERFVVDDRVLEGACRMCAAFAEDQGDMRVADEGETRRVFIEHVPRFIDIDDLALGGSRRDM